jgi:hypothetical protein
MRIWICASHIPESAWHGLRVRELTVAIDNAKPITTVNPRRFRQTVPHIYPLSGWHTFASKGCLQQNHNTAWQDDHARKFSREQIMTSTGATPDFRTGMCHCVRTFPKTGVIQGYPTRLFPGILPWLPGFGSGIRRATRHISLICDIVTYC